MNELPSDSPIAADVAVAANESRRDIALLREQVSLLQIQAADRRKPWYRERSLMISVGSLVIAMFTAGERIWVRADENINQRVLKLRETMIELAELQADFVQIQSAAAADPSAYNRGIALNGKRQLLLQNAVAALDDPEVHARTSPHVFLSLGYEMMLDGRYREAEANFTDSLTAAQRTKDVLLQVWAGRTLGQLYRVRGTGLDTDDALEKKSREQFKQAVALMADRTDEFGHKTAAETLLLQAQNEIAYGDPEFGKSIAARSKERIERMHPANFTRAGLLTMVQPLVTGQLVTPPTPQQPFPPATKTGQAALDARVHPGSRAVHDLVN